MLTPIMRPILQPVLVPVDYEYGDVFNPMSLFAGGKKGYTHDFLDRSTLFQDTAGTIPALAIGDPVGLVLDKTGNGNHLVQTTSTKRPLVSADGLYFDGVDDCFATVGVVLAEGMAMTVFYGGAFVKSSAYLILMEIGTEPNTTVGAATFFFRNHVSLTSTVQVYGGSLQQANSGGDPENTGIVKAFRAAPSIDGLSNWLNGTIGTQVALTGGSLITNKHFIGARNQAGSYYKGSIAYLMTIFKECSNAEVVQMSQFINNKMGGVY